MTVVIGIICEDGKIVVGRDGAIGFGDGYRRLMSGGKWWDMGCLVIGESGSDFALSRIRQKTVKHDPWTDLRDPYTFSELVCAVQTEVKGQEGTEPIEAELLHISGDKNNKPILHVIGGDGGITGPYPYQAIGHGATPAIVCLDTRLDPKYYKKKRNVSNMREVMTEALERAAQYADSVASPFFIKVFDPTAEFVEL